MRLLFGKVGSVRIASIVDSKLKVLAALILYQSKT